MNKSLKIFLAYLAVFIWPFIYCIRYVVAGENFSLTISNDFYYLYDLKVYLLDKLSNYDFPLWSPSEACGYPFYSNPFSQVFYPLNIFLTAFYKIAGGYSYADHQKFTVLGLSIFSVGLLAWLRSLNINILYAVLAVCLVGISSKMTEILRFPNAVHTVAWIPFILYGCTTAAIKKNKLIPAIVIFLSTIMMITAGYPYNAYHSIFLIIPYVIFLMILHHKKICFKNAEFSFLKYSLTLISAFLAAVVVCYPFIKGIKELMNNVAFRKGEDFAFSTFYKFTVKDTIGSLIYPPAATIEGWYYFGIAILLVVSAAFAYMILNRSAYKNKVTVFLTVLFWFLIMSFITYGEDSFLFKLMWDYFPGFSRIRIWGRMNVIFVPVFCLLSAYSLKLLSEFVKNKFSDTKTAKQIFFKIIILLSVFYLIILAVQIYLFKSIEVQNYSISYTKNVYREISEISFIIIGTISFILIICSLVISKFINTRAAVTLFLITVFLINTIDLYNAGSMQWASRIKTDTNRSILNVNDINMKSLTTPRDEKVSLISLTPKFNTGFVDEWSYENYKRFVENFKNSINEENMEKSLLAFNELTGIDNGRRFFISDRINTESVPEFIDDSHRFDSLNLIELKVEKYTGDELVCIADVNSDGYFSFIDNWDANWKAEVNGKTAEIEKLFGTFKSVKIGKGSNKIVFRYCPEFY